MGVSGLFLGLCLVGDNRLLRFAQNSLFIHYHGVLVGVNYGGLYDFLNFGLLGLFGFLLGHKFLHLFHFLLFFLSFRYLGLWLGNLVRLCLNFLLFLFHACELFILLSLGLSLFFLQQSGSLLLYLFNLIKLLLLALLK